MVLGRLPLTAKDGWAPPKANDRQAYGGLRPALGRRNHAGTYRIQQWKAE